MLKFTNGNKHSHENKAYRPVDFFEIEYPDDSVNPYMNLTKSKTANEKNNRRPNYSQINAKRQKYIKLMRYIGTLVIFIVCGVISGLCLNYIQQVRIEQSRIEASLIGNNNSEHDTKVNGFFNTDTEYTDSEEYNDDGGDSNDINANFEPKLNETLTQHSRIGGNDPNARQNQNRKASKVYSYDEMNQLLKRRFMKKLYREMFLATQLEEKLKQEQEQREINIEVLRREQLERENRKQELAQRQLEQAVEEKRIADEAIEMENKRLEEEKRIKLEAEIAEQEQQRLREEAAAQKRIKLETERIAKENKQVADKVAEQEFKKLEKDIADREKQRLAAEQAERDQKKSEADEELFRKNKKLADQQADEERIKLEEAVAKREKDRLIKEAAEAERIKAKAARDAIEKKRINDEVAEKKRQQMEATRLANEAEQKRLDDENAKKERERLEQEWAASAKKQAEDAETERVRLKAEEQAEEEAIKKLKAEIAEKHRQRQYFKELARQNHINETNIKNRQTFEHYSNRYNENVQRIKDASVKEREKMINETASRNEAYYEQRDRQRRLNKIRNEATATTKAPRIDEVAAAEEMERQYNATILANNLKFRWPCALDYISFYPRIQFPLNPNFENKYLADFFTDQNVDPRHTDNWKLFLDTVYVENPQLQYDDRIFQRIRDRFNVINHHLFRHYRSIVGQLSNLYKRSLIQFTVHEYMVNRDLYTNCVEMYSNLQVLDFYMDKCVEHQKLDDVRQYAIVENTFFDLARSLRELQFLINIRQQLLAKQTPQYKTLVEAKTHDFIQLDGVPFIIFNQNRNNYRQRVDYKLDGAFEPPFNDYGVMYENPSIQPANQKSRRIAKLASLPVISRVNNSMTEFILTVNNKIKKRVHVMKILS